jgi:gluconolactonase
MYPGCCRRSQLHPLPVKNMMKKTMFHIVVNSSIALFALSCLIAAKRHPETRQQSPVRIVNLDPRFDRLVPQDAKAEKIADGFGWVEGPVWNQKEKYLLFSDVVNNSIFKWQGKGVTLFLKPSGYTGKQPFTGREPGSNGLAYDSQGRLVLCQHGDRRVVRMEKNGKMTVLAGRYLGNRLNSPNDLVFGPDGGLYFTDPPFGLPRAFDDPGKELDFSGVYRLSEDGVLTLLTKELKAPNGIAFSPDGKTLYVSNADRAAPYWYAFPVNSAGTVGKGKIFADATSFLGDGPGLPDGMKVDRNGNIFTAGPGGIHVFAPDGTRLGSLLTGSATGNCAWGMDGSTLFIASGTSVYRIKLATKGAGF